MRKTRVELETDLNLSLAKLCSPPPTKPLHRLSTHLHSPRWEAGADHTASNPGASGVGREVLGSGLGGVQQEQEHELLRGRKGVTDSRNGAWGLVGRLLLKD